MRTFVISLHKDNGKRRAHIANEFNAKNVKFEFFDAITPKSNELYLKKYYLDRVSTELSEGEIACFLSHYILWQRIVDDSIPYVAIFEDDVYLGEKAGVFLSNSDWIPRELHVLKLEKGIQKSIKTSLLPIAEYNQRKIFTLKSPHYGTAGYIISNEGAKKLIQYYKNIAYLFPVDVVLFRVLLKRQGFNIGQLIPALCIQDFLLCKGKNFDSSLEKIRLNKYQHQKKGPKKFIKKAMIELFRPVKQLGRILKVLFFKHVDFF